MKTLFEKMRANRTTLTNNKERLERQRMAVAELERFKRQEQAMQQVRAIMSPKPMPRKTRSWFGWP
jgi:hypothetical protein